MTCRCDDYLSDSPQLHLQASVRQLLLDKQLSNALPDQMRDDWESLGPAGVVDLDVQLTMLNNRFVPDVNITCRDVSFVAPKFPIRLRQGNGRLRLVDDTLTIEEFSVLAADQRLHAQGEFHNPGPRGTGWLELNSEGPITLDHELISAMSEAGRRVVMSLQPAGGITLTRGRYEKSHPDQDGSSRWDLSLVDCSVQYERFPYAIHNVSGKLVLEDRRWDFQELRGEHGSSQIYCNGSWVPLFADQPGGNLTLNFTCRDVPLNDSLRNAVGKLNPGAEQFWNGISPRGTVDELGMTFQFNSVTHQSHLNLVAQKQPAQQNLQGRGITVRPSWFPLELQDCTGRIRYQDGRFQLENIAARHGHSRIELAGMGNLTKDHRWEVGLSQLIADTLPVDRDLLDALPAAMRAPIRQLKYQGVISLNGNAWMRGAAGSTTFGRLGRAVGHRRRCG